MVFSRVGPNQSIEWGQIRVSKSVAPAPSGPTIHRLFEAQATPADLDVFHTWTTATNEDLLSRAEREMNAGARIVFWGEGNAFLLKEEEATFVARGGDLAAKYKVYLGMAMGVVGNGQTPCCQNKLTLIEPDGRVAWEYIKARPVPGAESAHMVHGDGKLRGLETPYGRLSSIICFDGDFPQLLAQAGTSGTDVILDPSNDWHAIDPWHTQMASFRAIEQGFNLIRQTSQGLSASFDYQGRRLASMDEYHATDYSMISEVPTKGVRTIYSRLGDWFAWVCLAGLVLLTVQSVRRKVSDPNPGVKTRFQYASESLNGIPVKYQDPCQSGQQAQLQSARREPLCFVPVVYLSLAYLPFF